MPRTRSSPSLQSKFPLVVHCIWLVKSSYRGYSHLPSLPSAHPLENPYDSMEGPSNFPPMPAQMGYSHKSTKRHQSITKVRHSPFHLKIQFSIKCWKLGWTHQRGQQQRKVHFYTCLAFDSSPLIAAHGKSSETCKLCLIPQTQLKASLPFCSPPSPTEQ